MYFRGKHNGTMVCHLPQDLTVPCSNLDKEYKFIELDMMRAGPLRFKTHTIFVVYFDHQTGAPHAVGWLKSFVFAFKK